MERSGNTKGRMAGSYPVFGTLTLSALIFKAKCVDRALKYMCAEKVFRKSIVVGL
jgi:hypothetical protein